MCNFLWRSVKGFGRGKGSNFPFFPLTCVVALTTLSHYHASVWYLPTKFDRNDIIRGWDMKMAILWYYQIGGRPPSWICENCSFVHLTYIGMWSSISVPDFSLIGQYGADTEVGPLLRVDHKMTHKWPWPGSRDPKNDFQYGVRPPFWICYDVIILHPKTAFYVPNFLLNFHGVRFRNFCNILYFMFQHFGWKLPISGLISTIFGEK